MPEPIVEIATNWDGPNRPKLPMHGPSWITVHEVGNRNAGADEDMHRRFVHSGGGSVGVSFHFVVGPTKAIQLVSLNENAWHASDGYNGAGNRDSIAIETIQVGDKAKTRAHLEWLIAELLTNPQRFDTGQPFASDLHLSRIRQHNFWAPDAKNCPEDIRRDGYWPTLLANVAKLVDEPAKPPVYARRQPIPGPIETKRINGKLFVAIRKRMIVEQPVEPRLFADGSSPIVGKTVPAGKTITVNYIVSGADAAMWGVTAGGARIPMSAFVAGGN